MTQPAQPPQQPKDPQQEKRAQLWRFLKSKEDEFKTVLGPAVDTDRLLRVVFTAARKTPELLFCDQISIMTAAIKAAQMGLEPNTGFNHGYLIARKTRKGDEQIWECSFEPSYQGLIYAAVQSGACKAIWAEAVYEKDKFHAPRGHNRNIDHELYFGTDSRGEMIAVYAVAKLADGSIKDEVLRLEDIEHIKASSQQRGDNGIWAKHPAEMAKKSAIKRLFKTLGAGPGTKAIVAASNEDMDDELDNPEEALQGAPLVPMAQPTPSKGNDGVKRALSAAKKAPPALNPMPSNVTLGGGAEREGTTIVTSGEAVASQESQGS